MMKKMSMYACVVCVNLAVCAQEIEFPKEFYFIEKLAVFNDPNNLFCDKNFKNNLISAFAGKRMSADHVLYECDEVLSSYKASLNDVFLQQVVDFRRRHLLMTLFNDYPDVLTALDF